MAESVIKRDKKLITQQATWNMGALVAGASGYATIPVTPALPTGARIISINVNCAQVSALSGLQLTPFVYSGGNLYVQYYTATARSGSSSIPFDIVYEI